MVDYRGNPAVHIFADTAAALAHMRAAAEMAGCRIVSALPVDADLSTGTVPGAAILIELEDEGAGEAAVPLLDWLRREAERGARRGVVSAPFGLVDLIAARATHAGIEQLCAAGEAERLAALARAGHPAAAQLQDVGREHGSRVRQPSRSFAGDIVGPADAPFIRAMIRVRRQRGEHLPADLFADPVWDMLLDLMAARLEGKKVAVSSLCIASAVPPTTALRWIGVLAERGLIERTADPEDGRRAHVALTGATARAMGAWLGEARRLVAEAV